MVRQRDAAGGVCGGVTGVKRTGGEADFVVAGVVDNDISAQVSPACSLWEQSLWLFREKRQSHK